MYLSDKLPSLEKKREDPSLGKMLVLEKPPLGWEKLFLNVVQPGSWVILAKLESGYATFE